MIVYHGGLEVIPEPDLLHSRKAVDFGPGFYATPVADQAKRWAEKRKRRYGKAAISVYELADSDFARLNVLRFDSYSEEWLDFIIACRAMQDASQWDLVIGGVANDKVFDTLEAFFDGFASRAQTIDRLKLERPNLQICFRTEAALKLLKFVGGEAL